jgi:AcrR family transcriptional regulator
MAAQEHLPAEVRKQQIVNATLDLVAEYGVKGATLSRIAAKVGVTTPALYAHFANKREILLATLGLVFERIRAIHRSSLQANALERLREIGQYHTRSVNSKSNDFVAALFEFIAAPPSEGLREALGASHLELVDDFAAIVREGQRQGSIIKEADPEQIAWLIVSRHWTEDVAQLTGASNRWDEARSNRMLDFILSSVAVSPGIAAQVREDRG